MRVAETVYEVPGWGTGTLWTDGALVLAHDFDYRVDGGSAALARASSAPHTASDTTLDVVARAIPRAAPLEGAPSPPLVTLDEPASRVGHGSVSDARRRNCDPDPGVERATAAVEEAVARLTRFFAGDDALADVRLDVSWCTPFQLAALEALRRVPRGEVVSYGELAALAGRPGAQRAVGAFCAGNRFALLVPCHRVVAADGIGGYGSTGVDVKRRLLALEGVRL